MSTLNKILIVVAIIGIGAFSILYSKWKDLSEKYDTSIINNKAYQSELSLARDGIRMYKMSIDQLNYCNDSISLSLKKAIKDLKIKDKKIQSLSYHTSIITKTDTVKYRDTIFKNVVHIDTVLSDNWYKLKLGLHYPNKVIATPTFKSEKIVIAHAKRETVNPPKKFFLFRWFQKKHTVITVDIKENNPYIEQGKSRFIQIQK